MSTHVRCDECKREIGSSLRVTHVPFQLGMSGSTKQPVDFCSWRCVAAYASREADAAVAPKRVTVTNGEPDRPLLGGAA